MLWVLAHELNAFSAGMVEPSMKDYASFPMPDMDVLNALDDEALEQIIKANYEDPDYSIYVDPAEFDQESLDEQQTNCTETVWNVTLVPRPLRQNQTYVLVSSKRVYFR